MNIDNKLDTLKKIRQVEVPPFLFTRIRQEIQNLGNVEAPVKWKRAFAATAVLLLALNLSLFIKSSQTEKNAGIDTVVSSMKLSSTNALYHE